MLLGAGIAIGATVATSGCTSDKGAGSSPPAPPQTNTSTAPTSREGLNSIQVQDYKPEGASQAGGPLAFAYWTTTQAVAFFSENTDPKTLPIELEANEEPLARQIAVEQDPGSPAQVVDVIQVTKGSASEPPALAAAFWSADGTVQTRRIGSGANGSGVLIGAAMTRGACCAVVEIASDEGTIIERVYFTPDESNSRVVVYDKNTNTPPTKPLPTMPAKDIAGNLAGEFVFGIDSKIVGQLPNRQDPSWKATGDYGDGISQATAEALVLQSKDGNGDDAGFSLFAMEDGSRLVNRPFRSFALDPIAGTAAMSFAASTKGAPASLLVVSVASGKEVLSLSFDETKDLGHLVVMSAFDGRIVLSTDNGIKVISAKTGKDDPSYPAGANAITNLPIISSKRWALVGNFSATDQVTSDLAISLIYSETDLTWANLEIASS